jgi:CheY-like chemotaxis protein
VLLSSLGRREPSGPSERFAAAVNKPAKLSVLYDAVVATLHATRTGRERLAPQSVIDSELGARHPLAILVAEDNVVNQKVALALLRKLGYRADVVANGAEVLETLRARRYDVVLMDSLMPEMDGETATRAIRRDWPMARQPRIVAMTADAMAGDRERYLAAGMDDYVAKPVRIEELERALRRVHRLGADATGAVA